MSKTLGKRAENPLRSGSIACRKLCRLGVDKDVENLAPGVFDTVFDTFSTSEGSVIDMVFDRVFDIGLILQFLPGLNVLASKGEIA